MYGDRFARYLEERQEEEDPKKRKFAYPPNLVVIDGGKGQLGRAVEAMDELGIDNVTTISLAKRMEEVFVPGALRSDPDPEVVRGALPAAADQR